MKDLTPFSAREVKRALDVPLDVARTMADNTLVTAQAFYLFNSRFLNASSLRLGLLFSNRAAWLAVGVLIGLQTLFVYAPFIHRWFGTAPLEARHWLVPVAIGLTVFLLIELAARAASPPMRACIPALLLVLSLSGCGSTRITPPAEPREPLPVFVLDHGRHTSLVLTDGDGNLHRYAYGDWRYYAERDTSLGSALAALFIPTQGALGYRRLPGPATAATIRAEVRVDIVELHSLRVERARTEALRARLDALIAGATTQLDVPEVDLVFVPHPQRYSLIHNSNHMIADWLTELGCEVSRRPMLSGWTVMESGR